LIALIWLTTAMVLAADGSKATVTVRFEAGGSCSVAIAGTAALRSSRPDQPALAPGAGFDCPIPPIPAGPAVNVIVLLPDGRLPSSAEFPRLSWQQRDGRWVGTTTLPAAPAFVRVPQAGDSSVRDRRTGVSSMPWNFYGWFVFAVVFIGTYFLWVWRTTRTG
jgi:hypothetical protein